ncbi:MAG: FtsX-like permease family protein [Bacteroidales bacterium]|nr:MAG: FtsX-like permease family protein [Bacteroidales bacterium]
MKNSEGKVTRRRLRSSSLSSIISISLVLFMLGIIGVLVFNAKKLSDFVKENIGFSIFLHDDIREVDANYLRKTLDASSFVRYTEYISKERAAKELKEQLGEDFISFLGYNPLSASIDVRMKADYANQDSINKIETFLLQFKQVKEVHYQKSVVNLINENVSKISIVVLAFSGLLLFIALVLINNTIRLSVYSRRFIINTMKLVGATWGFIRKPFLVKSIIHGLYASLIAITMLSGLFYLVKKEFGDLVDIIDYQFIIIIFGMVILFGVLINLISTYFAVNKFLRLKADDLYY